MQHHLDNQDDARLVQCVLAGERAAFTPLVLRYHSSVLRLCQRLLGSTPEAQDIAQEAVLQSFLCLAQLQDPARFGAWLHAIAANLARMALRRRRSMPLQTLSVESGRLVPWAHALPGPEQVYASRELHDAIVVALNELSSVNRDVVIGFYLEGYSYAELAELLGVPVSTIKGRLFKSRRQLQRSLAGLASEVLSPDRRRRKELPMEAPELVEVTITIYRPWYSQQHPTVELQEKGGERWLPIWIGPSEADAISLALEGVQTPRPMTHDLSLQLLRPLGAQVERVLVNKLVETTYFAELRLRQGEQVYEIDARPSDAIALAVRTGAPIYVARQVLEQAGLPARPELRPSSKLASQLVPNQAFATLWPFLWRVLQPELGPDPAQVARLNWRDHIVVRSFELDGQSQAAVQVGSADQPAWMSVSGSLWEQISVLLDTMQAELRNDAHRLLDANAAPQPGAAQPVAEPAQE